MKRIEDYPILFVWTNENKKKNKKEKIQTKSAWDHLTPSIVHMFLCMCICLCNLIYDHIDFQYFNSFI